MRETERERERVCVCCPAVKWVTLTAGSFKEREISNRVGGLVERREGERER